MSTYRRQYHSYGYYFFTLVTYRRRKFFANQENIKCLHAATKKVKQKHPFSINAFVILPDHLHFIWKLPEADHDFSKRWRLIKRYFSLQMSTTINRRKEKEVWQRRFWEHAIRDENDWRRHMDYIHYNPVKHELVQSPKDWPHSSFGYWVEKGLYENNWGSEKRIVFSGVGGGE